MSNEDLLKRKSTWHFFHLCMSLVTGLWVFVWIACAVCNSIHNSAVDTRRFQIEMLKASQQKTIQQ